MGQPGSEYGLIIMTSILEIKRVLVCGVILIYANYAN